MEIEVMQKILEHYGWKEDASCAYGGRQFPPSSLPLRILYWRRFGGY
jgi:hypothetical protein